MRPSQTPSIDERKAKKQPTDSEEEKRSRGNGKEGRNGGNHTGGKKKSPCRPTVPSNPQVEEQKRGTLLEGKRRGRTAFVYRSKRSEKGGKQRGGPSR